ncbi:MAG: asparagine synthase (glutamine-hydrolyzing) [Bryobacteraceae bacterium]|nr:asparagine synthase (glutamine-hydrolyzing) [Bryobacteraceae bacterium]
MCGIAGYTHIDKAADPAAMLRATAAISHRGPDQSGTFNSDTVSLGAVRLKIIDLHGGEQPMRSDDGDSVIVFNGEVYNHTEIRHELEGLGVHFHSRCDTEVVLKAWLRWGRESFQKLRGMFAFAIWTESARQLVLCRDRLGMKPLYIHQRGEDLYFGSEMKALFIHDEIERCIDPVGLNLYLSLNYIPGPYTMIEGIRKLPPGHWLEWRNGQVTSDAYWKLEFNAQPYTLEAAKEELDHLLKSSVAEHLISDVPLGVWSSGGLDSSAVLHYAAGHVGSKLKTFSVSFKGRSFDESRWFREIAEKYGTDHHEFDLNPDVELRDAIEQMSYYSDEPSSDAGALPVWFLSKMCRKEVTVALSGEGADELFGGYNTYLADSYAARLRLLPRAVRKAMASASRLLTVSDDKIGLDYKVRRMLEGALLPPQEAHFFWNGTFSASQRNALLNAGLYRHWPPLIKGDFLYVDQNYYLPDDILYKTDRMSMAHSLEVRPPFLDHRIAEFAARLPHELKIHGSTLKYVLRELLKDKLPASVLTRKKEGFDIPAHQWLRTCLKPLVLETLNRGKVEKGGLFRWPVLHSFLASHLDRKENLGYHIWGLLTLMLWTDRWNIQPPRTAPTASHLRV